MEDGTAHPWRDLTQVTIAIDDLSYGCACGSVTVERQLATLLGVVQAYVNPHTEMAFVAFDPKVCQISQIQSIIRELGCQPGEPRVRVRL